MTRPAVEAGSSRPVRRRFSKATKFYKGLCLVLNFKAASFDELVVPVSQGKVFLLLEAVNPVQCDELDYFQALLRGIGVRDGSMLLDDFLSTGYLAAEAVVSDESEKAAGDVVDYFRQRKFRGVVDRKSVV